MQKLVIITVPERREMVNEPIMKLTDEGWRVISITGVAAGAGSGGSDNREGSFSNTAWFAVVLERP